MLFISAPAAVTGRRRQDGLTEQLLAAVQGLEAIRAAV